MPRHNNGPYLSASPNSAGFYEIRWTEGGRSQRRSTGERDARQAQQVFARFLSQAALRDEDESVLTIGEVIDIYILEKVPEFLGNKDAATSSLEMVKAGLGDILVNKLTVQDVNAYVAARAGGRIRYTDFRGRERGGRQATPGSVRIELGRLVSAINYCVATKQLEAKHRPYIRLPRATPAKDRWLTREEAARLLAAAQPDPAARLTRAYRFIAVGLYTAARRETIETLPWSRIYLKGDRSYIDFQDPARPVTRKRRGVVPVGPELLAVLERASKERVSDWFLDRPTVIQDPFDKAAERAGLEGVTPHTLRHTWATWAAQDGVSLFEIAGVLHDTVSTVEKRYIKHCPNHLRTAVARQLLGGGLLAAE